jgi:hypothetical protein
MNEPLRKYFDEVENKLADSAKLAGVTASDNLERGTAAEEYVASILGAHLPRRATIARHRQIVGADSTLKPGDDGVGPSTPVDILVYNEWTTMPNLVAGGYVLAESVYLALEVKARRNFSDLKSAISMAVTKQLPKAKVRKRLRPETTYFGNVRAMDELPLLSARTERPLYGLLGLVWSKNSGKQPSSIEAWLKTVRHAVPLPKRDLPWNWPDVIFVPKNFLIFKLFTRKRSGSGHSKAVNTRVWDDEYPFIPKTNCWPPANKNGIPLNIPGANSATEMRFGYLQQSDSGPNLLHVFLFWLCQEILKFALEVPDYHRYLLEKGSASLADRQAAIIRPDGRWGLANYNASKDEWLAVQTAPNNTIEQTRKTPLIVNIRP